MPHERLVDIIKQDFGFDLSKILRVFSMEILLYLAADNTHPIKLCSEGTFAVMYKSDKEYENILAWYMSPRCKQQHVIDFFEHRYTP